MATFILVHELDGYNKIKIDDIIIIECFSRKDNKLYLREIKTKDGQIYRTTSYNSGELIDKLAQDYHYIEIYDDQMEGSVFLNPKNICMIEHEPKKNQHFRRITFLGGQSYISLWSYIDQKLDYIISKSFNKIEQGYRTENFAYINSNYISAIVVDSERISYVIMDGGSSYLVDSVFGLNLSYELFE